MFYRVKVKDHVRVPPAMFNLPKREAVLKNIHAAYDGYISKELGFVVNVIDAGEIKEGVIVPGDGAGFYETEFELLTFKPELNELVYGKIRDITDFGAFLDLGGCEGMAHISQSMDDFVSFSKDKVLQGKKTGQSIKVGDKCKARIIAVSYKDLNNPKIGLSMRQEGLGKLEWLEAKEAAKAEPKAEPKAESKKETKK
ncbi:DNA-directed RNA polymerase [Candidatus Woesearchaeota archaeon]|nr:DNA-directed RNA polymerase [Candidatus Woesearchaeota archaeon]